jgi:hypothetical protein
MFIRRGRKRSLHLMKAKDMQPSLFFKVDTTGIRRLQSRLEKQSGHAKRSIAAAANRVGKQMRKEVADRVLQEGTFKRTQKSQSDHYDSVYEPIKVNKAKPALGKGIQASVEIQYRPRPWAKYFGPERVHGPGGGAFHNWHTSGPSFVPGAFGFDDAVGGRLGRGPWKRKRGAGRLPIQKVRVYSVWGTVRHLKLATKMKKRIRQLMRTELEKLSAKYAKGGT